MEGAGEALDAAWIKDVFIFLGAAGIVVPIFHRARVGAVFGFLIVGLIVGPFGLGRLAADYPWVSFLTIDDPERVEPFAELGVIFLLFLLGLALSIDRLWQMRRHLLGVGALQVGLSAIAIGAASLFADSAYEVAVVLGLCLALSSTAIVMQLLREQGRVASPVGRLSFAVLLFQDLMVVPILFITGVLGRGVEGGILLPLFVALGQAALVTAAIVVVGRFVARPLLRFVAATGSRDLIMAMAVLIVVAAAGGTGAAGLSTALGAFLAGLLLGETEYRHEIEVDLEPFKGLLIGLFFVTVGMSIDLRVVAGYAHHLLIGVAALVAIKAAILYGVAISYGVARNTAIESSLLLSSAGEFAFVIISLAHGDGLLGPELAQFATALVGVSMILTPLLGIAARRLGELAPLEDRAAEALPEHASELDAEVIIIGFGRVGRAIARALDREGVGYVGLDSDGALVTRERKKGHTVYFGDGRRAEILELAGAANATSIVATLSDSEGAERIAAVCRKHWPELAVCARARDREHAARLMQHGASVVMEALEPSLQLAGRVLEKLGFSDDRVAQSLAALRQAELEGAKSAAKAPKRHRVR